MDRKQLLMIAAGGSATATLGVFLPWATFSDEGLGGALKALGHGMSLNGIEGGDGKIVLVLALLGAGIATFQLLGKALPIGPRKAMLIAWIGLALASLISAIDVLNMKGPVSVGIGLWLCLAGSIAGAAASFLAWRRTDATPARATQTAEPQV